MEQVFYHSFNRGVEKRKIFLEEADYFRAVHDIYEFNDAKTIINLQRRIERYPISLNRVEGKDKLVDLKVWCLMPNHYHFFSSSNNKNSLSKFHQKFGIGFSNFFNKKYKRSGVLFQGKHKKVQVAHDTQALHLICYIHANPLDIWKPDWREKGLAESEIQEALNFLEGEYRWSSHLDYLGIKNFPSLIDTNFFFNFFKKPEEYREFFANWLRQYERNREILQKYTLE